MMRHRPLITFIVIMFCSMCWFVPSQLEADEPAVARQDRSLFLVIAPAQFHPAFKEYVAHKQQQLSTRVVALESVLKQTAGVDDPEKLKRYLYENWKTAGVTYVLLVGDADVLPVRYMVLDRNTKPAFNYAFYPSDLYYSDLADSQGEFDNWNAQTDGFHANYFGEVRGEHNKTDPINFDEIDYRPDIAIGRWPVSTLAEAKLVAEKTIVFEKQQHSQPPSASLLSVGGWIDSRPLMDRVGSSLPQNWEVNKRYFADSRRNDRTPAPSERDLVNMLNAGTSFVFHAGHGTDHTWQHCFSVKAIAGLKNFDRLPVMISAGCSTARLAPLPPYEPYVDIAGQAHKGSDHGEVFTSPPPPPAAYQRGEFNRTGLGEQLLKGGPNGAVAYIGCNTGSQPCGLTLLDGFARSLGSRESPRLGDCWADAIRFYYEEEKLADLKPTDHWYPPSVFFQGMKFMLFGDPTLMLDMEP